MRKLQDLENSISCRRATFGKFQILPARFGKFKILLARLKKFKILRQDFENSRSCRQDLESSNSCRQDMENSRSCNSPSSETQGQSVGLGERLWLKFSSTGERAPGYRLSPSYFQNFKRMPAPDSWKGNKKIRKKDRNRFAKICAFFFYLELCWLTFRKATNVICKE